MKEVTAYKELDIYSLTTKIYTDQKEKEAVVAGILYQVEMEGDEALYALTEQFDGVDLRQKGLKVSQAEIEEAYDAVSDEWLAALREARENVYAYHEKQKRSSWLEPSPRGVILGQILRPLERVGIYVPGGTAAYPSSVLMNAIPAAVAGVKEIVMTTPPRPDGSILPEVLVAAEECGVTEIYKLGGAQAVAALAYGASSVVAVDKITGPGNIYVTLAKKQVYGKVDIDMLAGPSEILILADESARPEQLAADLLSQAEHDPLSSAICISPCRELLVRVGEEVEAQLSTLPRQNLARCSWENYGALIHVEDLERGMALGNRIAPEHFELVVAEPFCWLGKIKHAGAVFLGPHTPESVGDYYAGPNHILPTGGTARFYSVLDVDTFMKKISVVHYSQEALQEDGPKIAVLARKEGLEAHARAVEIRLQGCKEV